MTKNGGINTSISEKFNLKIPTNVFGNVLKLNFFDPEIKGIN